MMGDFIMKYLRKTKVQLVLAGLFFHFFGARLGLELADIEMIVKAVSALFGGHVITDAAASFGALAGESADAPAPSTPPPSE